jgi:hypothetical protein
MNTTAKITLSALIESTNIPAPLVRAVVRQLGGWQSFTESAPDIARHGINGGFPGFIYHHDTEPFAKRNREHIAQMTRDQADDFGSTITEMIQNFGCFRNNKPSEEAVSRALYQGRNMDNQPNVLNSLAWYAGEEVARAFVDMTER